MIEILNDLVVHGNFPYHTIPDGSVWRSHHYNYAVLFTLILSFTVWDDYRKIEPLGVVGGLLLSTFAWFFMWGSTAGAKPVIGATLTLLGLLISLAFIVLNPIWYKKYPSWTHVAVGIGILVALDDVLEHTFGWPMPLDRLWKGYFAAHPSQAAVLVLAFVTAITGIYYYQNIYTSTNASE